ncbi:MAG TPA: hypothetical protein VMM92_00765 [Thermoanaerobaculia bacterium]|nr:hypothetical protein [Thermoanaerobaculia bacterium]
MAYTREGILAQVCVAFGQGTGEVRVSQEACLAVYERYSKMITPDVLDQWGEQAVQALERVRALGRMVATETHLAGQTIISAAQIQAAAPKVETNSNTLICGGSPPPS